MSENKPKVSLKVFEVSGTEFKVCRDIERRQKLGKAKYGVEVAKNPLKLSEWLNHLYEELLDAAIYAKRLKAALEDLTAKDPELQESETPDVNVATCYRNLDIPPNTKQSVINHFSSPIEIKHSATIRAKRGSTKQEVVHAIILIVTTPYKHSLPKLHWGNPIDPIEWVATDTGFMAQLEDAKLIPGTRTVAYLPPTEID